MPRGLFQRAPAPPAAAPAPAWEAFLPPAFDISDERIHIVCLALLLLLLLLVTTKLQGIHALLRPDERHASLADVPRMLVRKAWLAAYGAAFLVFSRDKVSKGDLRRAHDGNRGQGSVERQVR